MTLEHLSFDVDLGDPDSVVGDAWIRGWTIPPKFTVSQYADLHRQIAQGAGAEPGKWRTSRNPPQREIQDALSEHCPVQIIDLMKPVQWGATEIGINWVGYVMHLGLDSMLVAQPVKDLAQSWSTGKFGPALEHMPELQSKIEVDNTLQKKYSGGILWVIWCNSPRQLRQRTARYIFADEVDEYPDDLGGQGPADQQLAKRAQSYGDRGKLYRACTPTIKGKSKIEKGFNEGDQRRYKVPCPHCGHHQVLENERLTPRGTFVCPNCGAEIEEHHKSGMLVERSACADCGEVPLRVIHQAAARGVMTFADCCECGTVINPPPPDGAYWEPSNPDAPNTHRSYHIWGGYTPIGLGQSWASIAAQRAAAEADPQARVTFDNLVLAIPHEGERHEHDADEVTTLAEPGVHRGAVPPGGLVLTAGVDFQHDRAEIQVIAKGRGQRSWVVDYAVMECDPTRPDGFGDVDDYIKGSWLNHRGIAMTITAVALDGGNWTETVAQFIKAKVSFSGNERMIPLGTSFRKQNLYLVRGRSEKKSDRAVYRPSKTEVNRREKTVARSVGVWGVGTSVLKHIIFGWINGALQARKDAEREGEPDDIRGRMIRWPAGRGEPYDVLKPDPGALPPTYWKGLTCEYFDLAAKAWITPPGSRNEPLDTLVYAEWAALAPAVKVDVMRETQWAELEARFDPPYDLFAPAQGVLNGEAARGTSPVPPSDSRGTLPPDQASFGSDRWADRL